MYAGSATAILDRRSLSWPEKLGALAVMFRDQCGEVACPVTHRFEPGMYIREMFIPKGTYFIGRAHRYGHRVTLDSGSVRLILPYEDSHIEKVLHATYELNTVPYYQMVLQALTDVWGSTYHLNPTNSRNIDVLEADIFLPADDVFRIGESILYGGLPGIMS